MRKLFLFEGSFASMSSTDRISDMNFRKAAGVAGGASELVMHGFERDASAASRRWSDRLYCRYLEALNESKWWVGNYQLAVLNLAGC
jgi:hypothetical protein